MNWLLFSIHSQCTLKVGEFEQRPQAIICRQKVKSSSKGYPTAWHAHADADIRHLQAPNTKLCVAHAQLAPWPRAMRSRGSTPFLWFSSITCFAVSLYFPKILESLRLNNATPIPISCANVSNICSRRHNGSQQAASTQDNRYSWLKAVPEAE